MSELSRHRCVKLHTLARDRVCEAEHISMQAKTM